MDHKLIRAIGSVTCVMLLVKVLAMIKNILQARVYGAGVDADVFTLASSYSISLFTTMSYALCIAAIPILTQKLLSGKETCYQTANVLIANTMVLSLGATGVLFFAGAVGIIDPLLGIESNIPLFRFCFLVMVLSLPIITLTYLLLALFQTMPCARCCCWRKTAFPCGGLQWSHRLAGCCSWPWCFPACVRKRIGFGQSWPFDKGAMVPFCAQA